MFLHFRISKFSTFENFRIKVIATFPEKQFLQVVGDFTHQPAKEACRKACWVSRACITTRISGRQPRYYSDTTLVSPTSMKQFHVLMLANSLDACREHFPNVDGQICAGSFDSLRTLMSRFKSLEISLNYLEVA